MTSKPIKHFAAVTLAAALLLTGCGSNDEQPAEQTKGSPTPMTSHSENGHDHGGHDHPADGGPAPEGIVAQQNPTYPVGSKVVMNADHMPGMAGGTATVVGAYQTFTYAIDYTPTDGGQRVTDHKWVVQEELKDAGTERLANGAQLVVEADHMKGMKGATATIVSSTDETVYMVDFEADGMQMKNHKWVVESELQPA